MKFFLAVIFLSLSLHADTNGTVCLPLLQEGITITRDVNKNIDEFVHVTMPKTLQTITEFTKQLEQTTNVIDSKTSLGFFAAGGAVAATCVTFVALAAVCVWKFAGGKIDVLLDQRIANRIREQSLQNRAGAQNLAPPPPSPAN